MSSRHRKRVTLQIQFLDGPGVCDGCFVGLPAGEVTIYFDGLGVPGESRTFCLACISSVLIEANTHARAQRRARPIHVFVRKQGTNKVATVIELKGGPVVARRAIGGLSQKVDFGRYWLDLSELEEREKQAEAPPGG